MSVQGRQFISCWTWNRWTLDHSGRKPEPQLLVVSTEFEGRRLGRAESTISLGAFANSSTTACRMSTAATPGTRA